MKSWIRKAHRWLGLAFSITLLMSTGSGLLHIVMTRSQQAPPPARPSGGGLEAEAVRISLADAVAASGGTGPAMAANIRTIKSQPCYQLFFPGERTPRYVDATDGKADPGLEETYAAEIASNFLGGAQVTKTGYLQDFNDEYINIFRILPVHRFDSPDGKGTRVYVSTVTGSVTRHTDDAKQFEASAFTRFHKLGFIPGKDARDMVLGTITGGVFAVSLLGVALFFLTRPKRKKMTDPDGLPYTPSSAPSPP